MTSSSLTSSQVRIAGRGAGEQVEEVPLRHHGDVPVPAGNPGEIGGDHHAVTGVHAHASQLGVRQLGELGAEPQFVDQPHRRRVHRVATEIPEEVCMFFQHGDFDTGSGE